MANQRDVQQLIQGLTPSAVNNGNPNTVYNTPVPTVDAQGRWTTPTINPAATIGALNLPVSPGTLNGWVPPTGGTLPPIQGPILPQMPSLTPGGGGGTTPPPGTQPPPVQPPVTPPGGTGVGGTTPPYGPDNFGGTDRILGRLPGTVGGTGSFGWGRPMYGPGVTGPTGTPATGSGGGGFSWQQLLDMISEPLLPGDHYLENTGEVSRGNIIKGLLDAVVPGGGTAAEWIAGQTNPEAYFNHLLQIANNNMAGNQNDVQRDTNARVAAEIQKKLDEMFGPALTSTGSDGFGRGRQSAGATTIVQGPAAQQMVGDMQLNQFLQQLLRTGTMDRRFQVER